jgi:hypothetical protein
VGAIVLWPLEGTRRWKPWLPLVGMKRLMPGEDSGRGIGAEYEEAVRLHGTGGRKP